MELKQYLYDILTIENQIYTYQYIEKLYLKKIKKIKEEKNTIFLNNNEDYKKRKFHRSIQVVSAPDVKPNYIREKKLYHGQKEFIFGFRGINDMFRRVPERWLDGELKKLRKQEHNKFLIQHIIIWIILFALGILASNYMRNVLPIIIAFIFSLIICNKIGNENQKEYLPGNKVYDEFMRIYTQNYNLELKQKDAEFAPKIQHLTEVYESLVKRNLCDLEIILKQLYSQNVIHPKYQNFICISQIYDYLNIGRCTDLNGSNGAYNTYENEKNNDLLITDLDLNMFKLEKYESTMYTLVQLLKQNEKITSKIFAEINLYTNTTLLLMNTQYQKQLTDIKQRYSL